MVLVVEDDQLIQVMVDEALSDGGFESTITASGEEAVSFLRDDKSVYRAVVSDINLAGKPSLATRATSPAVELN